MPVQAATAGGPTNLDPMEDQATSPPPGTRPEDGPIPAPAEAEWPAKVADTIEDVVGAVSDRLVRPLTLVARGVVFGVVAATMALVLAVLGMILLVRLLDVYAFGGRVWASDTVLGGVLVGVGAFAWSKRAGRVEG